jgi:hypothetical protein
MLHAAIAKDAPRTRCLRGDAASRELVARERVIFKFGGRI